MAGLRDTPILRRVAVELQQLLGERAPARDPVRDPREAPAPRVAPAALPAPLVYELDAVDRAADGDDVGRLHAVAAARGFVAECDENGEPRYVLPAPARRRPTADPRARV